MSKHKDKKENELIEENNNQENSVKESESTENMAENSKDLALEEKLSQEKEKFIRLFAEFDNYKKRTTKERQDLIKYSNKDLIEALLPVLDDFDRAIKELEKDNENAGVLEGIKLIYNKLFNTLKDKGVSVIEVKPGDDFNIDLQEAITQVAAPNENLKDKIVDVVQKGYLLHDKVIRYAKVVVGK